MSRPLRISATLTAIISLLGCNQPFESDSHNPIETSGNAIASNPGQTARPTHSEIRTMRENAADLVLNESISARWDKDGGGFVYDRQLPGGGTETVRVDPTTGERRRVSTNEGKAAGGDTQDLRLDGSGPLHPSRSGGAETTMTFVNETDGEVVLWWIDTDDSEHAYGTLPAGATKKKQHTFSRHVWRVLDSKGGTLGVYEATPAPGRAVIDGSDRHKGLEPPADSQAERVLVSPDGRSEVFVQDHNLYSRSTQARGSERAKARQLTSDGHAGDGYDPLEARWSPDGTMLAALRTEAGQKHEIHMVESSPKQGGQPKLRTVDYLKPGDEIPHPRVVLVNVRAASSQTLDDAGLSNPWSITHLNWAADSSRLFYLDNERGHQRLAVVSVDVETRTPKIVIDERSETFIDYAGKLYLEYLDDTDELVWMSERSGQNHLYLIDAKVGTVIRPLTSGDWVVRGADKLDRKARTLVVRAGGVIPGQDPYYVHHGRVNLDDGEVMWLTQGDGTHEIEWSPQGGVYLDRWSRVDLPPVTELRSSADGALIGELERADWSGLLATGWRAPERFVAKGRDGETDIYGVIWRPSSHRADAHYPVVEYIYAGPHAAFAPKSFAAWRRPRSTAQLGMIVVQLDGMGTSHRSKAFQDVAWKNLGDSGFPDRMAWIRAAAEHDRSMDLSRVGIYGGSAGGQSTLRGLLMHPQFYSVGVADCGCHDNRMDKIWWNELWMGWPVGEHYAEQSNITQAHRLEGDLMLIVGELDDNVDPASTMQVVDALVKADKDFELLVLPGVGHGAAETPYGSRRRADFLSHKLLGYAPAR